MIHIEKFLQSKRSERTRMHYRSILYSYSDYCKAHSLESINADSVVSYIDSLNGNAPATIDNKAACLKSYFGFIGELGVLPIVKLKNRLPSRNAGNSKPTNGLSDSEVTALLECIQDPFHSALFSLMLFTGIRISELQSLRIDDIKMHDSVWTIQVYGKGGKYRTIPLQKGTVKLLEPVLLRARSKRGGTGNWLFTLDGINPIHKNSIRKWLKDYCLSAGIHKKISPHSLRVSCISNALEVGCSPIYVQYLGGWATMEMVLRYDRRRNEIKNSPALRVNYATKKQ